ncbi:YjcZ family sporulation protein [Neobacillus niacini]|nr:YjcZ family sporulation protein [Neobacillus niacini]
MYSSQKKEVSLVSNEFDVGIGFQLIVVLFILLIIICSVC